MTTTYEFSTKKEGGSEQLDSAFNQLLLKPCSYDWSARAKLILFSNIFSITGTHYPMTYISACEQSEAMLSLELEKLYQI